MAPDKLSRSVLEAGLTTLNGDALTVADLVSPGGAIIFLVRSGELFFDVGKKTLFPIMGGMTNVSGLCWSLCCGPSQSLPICINADGC
eukprot:2935339-Rhodomonas_salina.1